METFSRLGRGWRDIRGDSVDNIRMFVCEKVARGHRYLYLVESVREGKRVRQRTIRALGRKDVLHASGELDRLVCYLDPTSTVTHRFERCRVH